MEISKQKKTKGLLTYPRSKKEQSKNNELVENKDLNKCDFSTPTKSGYVDILQQLYGDAWLTPSVLQNDFIREELECTNKKHNFQSKILIESDSELDLVQNSEVLPKSNFSMDLIRNSQMYASSSSENDLNSYTNTKHENIIYVSDSDSNASKSSECLDKLTSTNSTNTHSSKNFDKKTTRRKLKKKEKSFDSFIVGSSESLSSGSDDINTPAYYNRLDSLIKKSATKSKTDRPDKVLRSNLQKKLKYSDNSSDHDDDDDNILVNATICGLDEDEEIDSLSENINDLKFFDNFNEEKHDLKKDNKKLTFLESLSENVEIASCHKDAIPYLKNFKKTREKLSRVLFNLYNEKVFNNKLSSNMDIIWCNNLRTTGGLCQSKRIYKNNEVCYVCTIKLSTKVVDRPCRLRDTLIHELCHAANFEIDKIRDAKHTLKWKYWTRKAEKSFPDLPPISTLHNYIIEYNFSYRCTKCTRMIYRHKNSFKETNCYCGGLVVCQKRQADGTYKDIEDKKTPSVFARFVKENYNKVNTPERTHRDCMKELSKMYSQKKLSL